MKFLPDIPKSPDTRLSNIASAIPRFALRVLGGFLLLLLLLPAADAQSRKDLESKRKKLIADIKVTSSLLNKKAKSRAAALDRYVALKNQIKNRETLLQTLQEEVVLVDENIQRNTGVVAALGEDILRLEEEYGLMARKAQRLQMSNSRLLFIFSADGFNDALKRWQYIRQYDNYRKKQAHLIIGTKSMLSQKITLMGIQKEDKELLMASEQEQKVILEQEMIDKGVILKTLRKDESRLRSNLAGKRKAHQKLNTAIENTIRKEIIVQRRKNRKPEALATAKPKSSSAKQSRIPAPTTSRRRSTAVLTGDFRNHRGRLSWPVSSGVITSYFGKQAHPTLKKIQITNNGIDIQTQQSASVRAVFQGEVVTTQFIPGHHYMVILRHGDYFTVYSNLESVSIKSGQMVDSKQVIGQVAMDRKSGKSEVHFEVWRDKVRLNPTDWVRR